MMYLKAFLRILFFVSLLHLSEVEGHTYTIRDVAYADMRIGTEKSLEFGYKVTSLDIMNNADERHLIFTFSSASLHDIVINTKSMGGRKQYQLGNRFPYHKRIVDNRNILLPLRIKSNEILQIQWKSKAKNYRTFVNFREDEMHINATDNLLLGFFFGICYIFTFFLIGIYIFTKNSFFLYYLFLVEITIFIYIHLSGIGFQYIWGDSPIIQFYIGYIFYALYIMSHILFVRLFFNTKINFYKINRLFSLLLVIIFVILMTTILTIIFPSIRAMIPIWLIKNVVYVMFTLYGLLVTYIIFYTFKRIRRKEIIWVSAGLFLHVLLWIFIFSQIESNILFTYLYSFWYKFNILNSHLSLPHIMFHITLLEYFLIVYYISISFYKDIKRYSMAQFRLHAIENKILSAYITGQYKEKGELSEKLNINIVKDLDTQIEYYRSQNEALAAKLSDIRNHLTSLWEKPLYNDEFVFTSTHDLASHIVQDILAKHVAIEIIQESRLLDFKEKNNYVNLYHIITEISNNIVKHAKANNVLITMYHDEQFHYIKIHDDGIGFVYENVRSGLGMVNIQKRISLLQGEIKIDNSHFSGTTIVIALPLYLLKNTN